jgi:hypothetical protein
MATPASRRRETGRTHFASALRAALVGRALVCAFVAWRILDLAPATASSLADAFREFVLIDGVLALIVALLVFTTRWHRGVAGLAALDGVFRLAAYWALVYGPGIPDFAVTFVVYAGLLAIGALSFGVLDVFEANRLRREPGVRRLAFVLAAAGVGTIVLAVAMFFMNPAIANYRTTLIVGVALQGLTMLAVAVLAGDAQPAASEPDSIREY